MRCQGYRLLGARFLSRAQATTAPSTGSVPQGSNIFQAETANRRTSYAHATHTRSSHLRNSLRNRVFSEAVFPNLTLFSGRFRPKIRESDALIAWGT